MQPPRRSSAVAELGVRRLPRALYKRKQENPAMSATTFFEINFQLADFTFEGRDEIEDPLNDALRKTGLGEVTGGGAGMGCANIDVEVTDPQRGLALIRQILRDLQVAPSTVIQQYSPEEISHPVYDHVA